MHTLYTLGYTGAKMGELRDMAAAGALILDTRLNPASRHPEWWRNTLARELGSRYRHERRFGNRNYRNGGEIAIEDFDGAWPELAADLGNGPVVLLCACADHRQCHRSVVAELAQERLPGLRVVHLKPRDSLIEPDQD